MKFEEIRQMIADRLNDLRERIMEERSSIQRLNKNLITYLQEFYRLNKAQTMIIRRND